MHAEQALAEAELDGVTSAARVCELTCASAPAHRAAVGLREQFGQRRRRRSPRPSASTASRSVIETAARTAFSAHSALRPRCSRSCVRTPPRRSRSSCMLPVDPSPPCGHRMRGADVGAGRHRRDVRGHGDEHAGRGRARARRAPRRRSPGRRRESRLTIARIDGSSPPGRVELDHQRRRRGRPCARWIAPLDETDE